MAFSEGVDNYEVCLSSNRCGCTTQIIEGFMFGVLHMDGSGEDNPSLESLSNLYDELLIPDPEHGDVSVINDA